MEVAKNQPSSPYNSLNMTEYSFKDTAYYYKTIVLSGGEGYEEYKSNVSSSTGNTSTTSNSNLLGSNLGQQQNPNSDNQLNTANQNNSNNNCNNVLNLSSSNVINSTGALLQSQNSFASSNYASNCDENSNGKDDLINYVITWEL